MSFYPQCPACGATGPVGGMPDCACTPADYPGIGKFTSRMVERRPYKCVIWAPPYECEAVGRALNCPTLHLGMTREDIEDALRLFRHMKEGAIVVSVPFGVVGYSLGPSIPIFLDGCPTDPGWRAQAQARSDRVHPHGS